MKLLNALLSGLAGAATLTVLHQVLKNKVKDAPEMDILGMQAIARSLDNLGLQVPDQASLYRMSLAGDLLFNSVYYAFTATGKIPLLSGTALGLSAGLGAIGLPGPLGLDENASGRTTTTKILSVLIYLAGGVAAASTYDTLERIHLNKQIKKVL